MNSYTARAPRQLSRMRINDAAAVRVLLHRETEGFQETFTGPFLSVTDTMYTLKTRCL